MINEQGSFDNLKMVYRGIVLDEYQIAIMDSGNIRVPIPEWGRIGTDHGRREDLISYKYYIKESTRFDILNFCTIHLIQSKRMLLKILWM